MVDGSGQRRRPLVRDRVFFFANYEYNPLKAPQPVTIDAGRGRGASACRPRDLGNSPFGETFHTPSVKVNFRANDSNSGFVRYNRFTNDQPGAGGGLTTPSRSVSFKDRMYGVGAQLATTIGNGSAERAALRLQPPRRSCASRTCEGAPNGAHINITGVANFGVNPLAGIDQRRGELADHRQPHLDARPPLDQDRHRLPDDGLRRHQRAGARLHVLGPARRRAAAPAVTPLQQYLNTVGRRRSIRRPAVRSPTRSCSRNSATRRCSMRVPLPQSVRAGRDPAASRPHAQRRRALRDACASRCSTPTRRIRCRARS